MSGQILLYRFLVGGNLFFLVGDKLRKEKLEVGAVHLGRDNGALLDSDRGRRNNPVLGLGIGNPFVLRSLIVPQRYKFAVCIVEAIFEHLGFVIVLGSCADIRINEILELVPILRVLRRGAIDSNVSLPLGILVLDGIPINVLGVHEGNAGGIQIGFHLFGRDLGVLLDGGNLHLHAGQFGSLFGNFLGPNLFGSLDAGFHLGNFKKDCIVLHLKSHQLIGSGDVLIGNILKGCTLCFVLCFDVVLHLNLGFQQGQGILGLGQFQLLGHQLQLIGNALFGELGLGNGGLGFGQGLLQFGLLNLKLHSFLLYLNSLQLGVNFHELGFGLNLLGLGLGNQCIGFGQLGLGGGQRSLCIGKGHGSLRVGLVQLGLGENLLGAGLAHIGHRLRLNGLHARGKRHGAHQHCGK